MMPMRDQNLAFQFYSLNESNDKIRDYKRRRFSAKTKSGCLGCKTKRVKVRLYLRRSLQS